jgi:Holliday junction resolvase RusA-like endonuclease
MLNYRPVNYSSGVLMAILQFKAPFPPSSNTAYYTDRRTGTRHLSSKGKAYKEEVGFLVNRFRDFFPGKERLYVKFNMHPPDSRRRDIMNFEKLLTDCFSKVIFKDDCQIDHFEIIRGKNKPGGSVEVSIEDMFYGL